MSDQSKNCEQTSRIGPANPEEILGQKIFLENIISRSPSPQDPSLHRRTFLFFIFFFFPAWGQKALRSLLEKIMKIGGKKL